MVHYIHISRFYIPCVLEKFSCRDGETRVKNEANFDEFLIPERSRSTHFCIMKIETERVVVMEHI